MLSVVSRSKNDERMVQFGTPHCLLAPVTPYAELGKATPAHSMHLSKLSALVLKLLNLTDQTGH